MRSTEEHAITTTTSKVSYYNMNIQRKNANWLRVIGYCLSLCGMMWALGCGDRDEAWDALPDTYGPYAIGSRVFWLDSQRGIAIEPLAENDVTQVPISRRIFSAQVVPSKDRILALAAPFNPTRKGESANSAKLVSIVANDTIPDVRTYVLPNTFDRIAASDDGTVAVTYYSENGLQSYTYDSADAIFRNPNQIAILRLDQAPGSENPTTRTLRSFGAAPSAVVISPPITIANEARRLAVVLSEGLVTLLDLAHPQRREISVPLTVSTATESVTPVQVLFATEGRQILVRATGTEDIFTITLSENEPEDVEENDFTPVVGQPSVGAPVLDMLLVGSPATHALAANEGNQVALINLETNAVVSATTTLPVDTIVDVSAKAPNRVLAFNRADPQQGIHLVDVERLAAGLANSIVYRALDADVTDVIVSPEGGYALLVHDDSRTAISVLDLADTHMAISPIEGFVALHRFSFVSDTELVGINMYTDKLGRLDLSTLQETAIPLEYYPTGLVVAGERVVVVHESEMGAATVVEPDATSREQTKLYWGFFVQGLLNERFSD